MKTARSLRVIGILAGALALLGVLSWTVYVATLPIVLAIAFGLAIVATLFARRISSRVKPGTILELDLDGGVIEQMGTDPVGLALTRQSTTVRDIVDALTRAAHDPRVAGLVARIGNGGIQMAHAQELRDVVHAFRDSGKRTVAFSESFGESKSATVDYYLASAFETIVLQPGAGVSTQGVLGQGRFVRGLFDKLGIVPDLDHRMEYKAAKNMFTETGFTDAHRESVEMITGELFTQIVDGIASDRGLSQSVVAELFDRAPLLADEALEGGLVDQLGYRDEAFRLAGDGPHLFVDFYQKRAKRTHRKGARIGLIYGTGTISRGSSSFDLLGGSSSFGADDVAKAFRLAIEDQKLKAIVFRVDSPGGSAVASDVVNREVLRAKEAGKPVVVSMSNVAASGGYWVSASADKIVAQPGTITGSIGVVGGKLATRQAWAKAGVTFAEIAHGENATFFSNRDTFTDSERARHAAGLDGIYRDFTAMVADGRGMDLDQVREIAKGRVWTGSQAKENGLVDELGGLERAIEVAKGEAGIPDEDSVSLVVYPKKRRLFPPEKKDSSEPIYQITNLLAHSARGVDPALNRVRMPDLEIT